MERMCHERHFSKGLKKFSSKNWFEDFLSKVRSKIFSQNWYTDFPSKTLSQIILEGRLADCFSIWVCTENPRRNPHRKFRREDLSTTFEEIFAMKRYSKRNCKKKFWRKSVRKKKSRKPLWKKNMQKNLWEETRF